jgi:two-component system response regulator (stage 0 sporulation protein F)
MMNKILVVDDDYAIRLLYEEELRFEGYQVVTASGSAGLMEIIDEEQPDLVLLDIVMGDSNGLDVLQKIRNAHYDLPVIICTAYETYRHDLKSFAADYYVVKSSDLSEMKLRIKMAMETQMGFIKIEAVPAVVNAI